MSNQNQEPQNLFTPVNRDPNDPLSYHSSGTHAVLTPDQLESFRQGRHIISVVNNKGNTAQNSYINAHNIESLSTVLSSQMRIIKVTLFIFGACAAAWVMYRLEPVRLVVDNLVHKCCGRKRPAEVTANLPTEIIIPEQSSLPLRLQTKTL